MVLNKLKTMLYDIRQIKYFKLANGNIITHAEVKTVLGNAWSQDNTKLKRLIELGLPVDVNFYLGLTPLMVTCWRGTLEDVKFFVDAGADIYALDKDVDMYSYEGRDAYCALQYAKWNKDKEVLDYMESLYRREEISVQQ